MRTKITIPLDPDIEATELTNRQKQVLQVIREFIKKRGYPPTIREAGERLGLTSSASIHAHMAALIDAGYISRDQMKPRALEVLMEEDRNTNNEYRIDTSNMISIPLLGRVTAGVPILAEENIEDYFYITRFLSFKNW